MEVVEWVEDVVAEVDEVVDAEVDKVVVEDKEEDRVGMSKKNL